MPKSNAAVAEAPATKERGLSESKVKILEMLAKNPSGLTRSQMAERTGIKKGWSKLLGASTKADSNVGMESDGLIKSAKVEGIRGLVYTITSAGKKALEKAKK